MEWSTNIFKRWEKQAWFFVFLIYNFKMKILFKSFFASFFLLEIQLLEWNHIRITIFFVFFIYHYFTKAKVGFTGIVNFLRSVFWLLEFGELYWESLLFFCCLFFFLQLLKFIIVLLSMPHIIFQSETF